MKYLPLSVNLTCEKQMLFIFRNYTQVQLVNVNASAHGCDQLIFAILVTNMLCCFLSPPPTFPSFFPSHSVFPFL